MHALVPNDLKQHLQISCGGFWPGIFSSEFLTAHCTLRGYNRLLKLEIAAVVQVVCFSKCFSSCTTTATLLLYMYAVAFQAQPHETTQARQCVQCRTPATIVQYRCSCWCITCSTLKASACSVRTEYVFFGTTVVIKVNQLNTTMACLEAV